MTVDQARKIILSQAEAVESEHHGHPDFRVNNKIFATMWPDEKRSVLRLPMEFAESQEKQNEDRCKVVSRSGGMGWLSVNLPKWSATEFRPMVEVARSQMRGGR